MYLREISYGKKKEPQKKKSLDFQQFDHFILEHFFFFLFWCEHFFFCLVGNTFFIYDYDENETRNFFFVVTSQSQLD